MKWSLVSSQFQVVIAPSHFQVTYFLKKTVHKCVGESCCAVVCLDSLLWTAILVSRGINEAWFPWVVYLVIGFFSSQLRCKLIWSSSHIFLFPFYTDSVTYNKGQDHTAAFVWFGALLSLRNLSTCLFLRDLRGFNVFVNSTSLSSLIDASCRVETYWEETVSFVHMCMYIEWLHTSHF